jgi:hypothetical protein
VAALRLRFSRRENPAANSPATLYANRIGFRFALLDGLPCRAHHSFMRKGLRVFLLLVFACLASGCTTGPFGRQSDLEWQKYNPEYKPLYPDQRGREWGF